MNAKGKIEAVAITAMIVISVFAGIMLAMAQQATPEDTDGMSNVVPGHDIERAYLRGDIKTLISASMGVVFVAVFIVMAITAIRRSEEEEVERVVEILKRAKRIKEEIERRGENLTREYDIILAQVLAGINDLKSWSLFGTGLILSAILAFGIAIITML